MKEFKEAYDYQRTLPGRFRTTHATDISAGGDTLLGVVARTSCAPNQTDTDWDNHNTLITLYHTGNSEKWERVLEKCAKDAERVSVLSKTATHNGQQVDCVQMHSSFTGYSLKEGTRKKMKAMVDCLNEEGLIKQTTAESLYTQLSLIPPPPEAPPHTERKNARY